MSDGILSGLRAEVPDKSYALDELTGTQAYEWALNDVREALSGKVIVDAADLYLVLYTSGTVERSGAFRRLCDAVDAAAGGDQ